MTDNLLVLCRNSMVETSSDYYRSPSQTFGTSVGELPSHRVIETDGRTITIEFMEMEREGSTIRSEYLIDTFSHELKNFVHDFTFEFLSAETDDRLGKYFPKLDPRYANLTPDVILLDGKTMFVVEFTTNSSCSKESLRRSYDSKILKYEPALKEALESRDISDCGISKIYFYIIAVNKIEVLSNLSFEFKESRNEHIEISLRFAIALRVMQDIQCSGLMKEEDAKLSKEAFQTLQWARSIKIQERDDDDEFSYANYKKCLEPHNQTELKTVVRKCFDLGKEMVIKERAVPKGHTKSEGLKIEIDSEVRDFEKRIVELNPEGTRCNMKSVVNLPLISLKQERASLNLVSSKLQTYLGDSEDPTFRVWEAAKSSFFCNSERFQMDADSDVYNEIGVGEVNKMMESIRSLTELEPSPKAFKSLYHRVPVEIPDSIKEYLACLGINGKAFRDNNTIRRHRAEKHKPFDFSTDISDIENFLSSSSISEFFEGGFFHTETLTNELNLIEMGVSAHDMSKLSRDYLVFLRKITETRIFSWAKMISDIATEISISMKQHCKRNEFLLKKLKDFNLFLLIKPTKSSEQCFFSIMVFNEDLVQYNSKTGNLFRPLMTNGTVSWTEFVSVNQSKLVNWNLLESRVLTLVPYWLEFHGNDPFILTKDQLQQDLQETKRYTEPLDESYKMTWFSILVCLADKAEIEETLSLSRFMVMEAFVTYPLIPRPHKMIEKFTTNIRSRLTIFIMKRLISLCFRIVRGDIKGESEGIPDSGISFTTTETIYRWSGLVNWITGYPLSNPGQVINLMYLGYIKNKNENTELNTESKLLNKILTLEEKLTPEIQKRIGRVNKVFDSGTYHEYNLDIMKHACYQVKKKHRTKQDKNNFTNQVSATFLEKISTTSVESVFTTLKASSNFDEKYFIYADYFEKFNLDHKEMAARANKEYKETGEKGNLTSENFKRIHAYYRSKIIEKCMPYVEGDKIMVKDILPICLEEVKSNKYMRICIFKKQQHGGLREIYVLNFAERVLQYFIETAGRVLCEMFPGETMTHPENKKRIPEAHARDVKTYFSKGATYTTFTSADSAKWNQNQYCHKFALMMVNLYSDDWHGVMWEILQMWRRKYIKISDGLLHKFHSSDSQKFHDEVTRKMYRGYKDLEPVSWIQKGRSYIITRSGMMQGILHYVSSAFHSMINASIESHINRRIREHFPGARSSCSTIQSSDDSGMILSINHPDSTQANKKKMLCWLAAMHYFKCAFSEEVAIKNSVKTTFHCSRVFEFNSKFYFANFHYEPDIKLAFASVLISQQENFIERQEELYTLLTSYITTGGSFYSAFYIQCSQALLFYRGLGCTVTTKFSLLTVCQTYLRDPSSGFFLMDNCLCPGLPGFSYNLWVSLQSGRLSEAYNDQLELQVDKNKDLLETTSLGHIIRKAFISFGSTKKLEQMKRRMGITNDWVEEMDTNPQLLFRDAQTTSEFKTKIGLKLSQRGVATSLSTGVPITSVIASSVYILSAAVFKVREAEQGELIKTNYKGEAVKRASLFPLIAKTLTTQGTPLNEEKLKILFHKHDEYKLFSDKLKTYLKAETTRKLIEKRRVVTTLTVFKDDSSLSISKYQLLKLVWFKEESSQNPLYPQKLVMEVFNKMKESIRWLSDSFQESLDKSPFVHAHQMVNWFKQLDSRSKVVCLLGAPLSTKRGKSTIGAAITSNFGRFHRLAIEAGECVDSRAASLEEVLHNLVSLSTLPITGRDIIAREIISKIPLSAAFDPSKVKSRYNSLITMRDAVIGEVDRLTLFNQIASNQIGYVGAWTLRQRFNRLVKRYEGPGIWDGVINGVLTHIEVSSYSSDRNSLVEGSKITEITVKDWNASMISDFEQGMRQWVRDSNVTPNLHQCLMIDHSGRELMAFYTDKVSCGMSGSPIYLTKSPANMLQNIEMRRYYAIQLSDFSDVLEGRSIRVRLVSKEDSMASYGETIMSVQLYSTDWRASCKTVIPISLSPIATNWLMNQPLEKQVALTQIDRVNKKSNMSSLMSENLKSWLFEKGLREGMRRPLTVLGVGAQLTMESSSHDSRSEELGFEDTDDEFAEELLDDLVKIADQDMVFDCDLNLDDHDPLGLLDIDAELVNEDDFAFYLEGNDRIFKMISNSNRLMSELADSLVRVMPIMDMNETIRTGRYTSNHESAIPLLEWIFPDKTFYKSDEELLELKAGSPGPDTDDYF